MGEPMCKCEGDWGLFVWRGDPEWWSCVGCDGRVRKITEAEKAELTARRRVFSSGNG
jgi:hypothetical protein